MRIHQVVLSFLGMIVKVILAILVVMLVYKGAVTCYDFGYRVFNEPAMCGEDEEPEEVTVAIVAGKSVKQVGTILKNKGLIRDVLLFQIQELISGEHGNMQPGVYTFTTDMTAKEMIIMMAQGSSETEDYVEETESTTDTTMNEIYDENADYGDSEDSYDNLTDE